MVVGWVCVVSMFWDGSNTPSEIDMLNILVTASVILRAVHLSIIAEISSSPLDLVVCSEHKSL